MSTSLKPRDLIDAFLSEGRHAFTVEDAAEAMGSHRGAALDALARLQRRNEVFSPAKGLYVAIPPEFRSWGVVPGTWFIDVTMRHLDRPYYVALLSAARIHGAAHQAAQVFQVMTDSRPIRNRDLARVRLRFYASKFVDIDSTEPFEVPTGYATVSSKETTVVDLVTYSRAAGGYSNVATLVRELGALSAAELARAASRRSRAVARRTGWFVENFGASDDLEPLRQAARLEIGEPTLLDRSGPKRGQRDPSWNLRINRPVEPDV